MTASNRAIAFMLMNCSIFALAQSNIVMASIKGTRASVSYDKTHFRDCQATIEPQNTDKDMEGQLPWAIAPRHYLFKFKIDPSNKFEHMNELRLIPIHGSGTPEFKKLYSDLSSTVEKLRPLLAKKPLRFPLGSTIPEWNLTDSEQTIHAKVKYLNFPSHKGVFFISQETQESDGNPINSNETYCSYQGLSDDGEWYIDLYLSISNPSLPKDASAADNIPRDSDRKYLLAAESILEALNPASFTPNLTQIERLISSIQLP
ncbi:hypothetical protein GETHLI_35830 [Geothrix limicola]|uniref:Uncharacterized protein n=1 Tax=Geothrix limicola TaxID=2927978 RepID=A0ABQ5QME7_9BACT|nr:hypothetical protein [Geothrix limicola]GLH75080.1 hypothetical protein GETHLI_35830 [Geothrix limicola]